MFRVSMSQTAAFYWITASPLAERIIRIPAKFLCKFATGFITDGSACRGSRFEIPIDGHAATAVNLQGGRKFRRDKFCAIRNRSSRLGVARRTQCLTVVGSCETSRGKLEDGCDLFGAHVKPRHDVFTRGTRFEIFKDGGDRHARSAKDPGSAHFFRRAFDGGAL